MGFNLCGKGILRKEIVYAKDMMEGIVRKIFLKMIARHIECQTNFSVSFGKNGRFIDKYLSTEDYRQVLKTYPEYHTENIKRYLFLMLFCKRA